MEFASRLDRIRVGMSFQEVRELFGEPDSEREFPCRWDYHGPELRFCKARPTRRGILGAPSSYWDFVAMRSPYREYVEWEWTTDNPEVGYWIEDHFVACDVVAHVYFAAPTYFPGLPHAEFTRPPRVM